MEFTLFELIICKHATHLHFICLTDCLDGSCVDIGCIWCFLLDRFRKHKLALAMLHVVLPEACVLCAGFFVNVVAETLLHQIFVPANINVTVLVQHVDV